MMCAVVEPSQVGGGVVWTPLIPVGIALVTAMTSEYVRRLLKTKTLYHFGSLASAGGPTPDSIEQFAMWWVDFLALATATIALAGTALMMEGRWAVAGWILAAISALKAFMASHADPANYEVYSRLVRRPYYAYRKWRGRPPAQNSPRFSPSLPFVLLASALAAFAAIVPQINVGEIVR